MRAPVNVLYLYPAPFLAPPWVVCAQMIRSDGGQNFRAVAVLDPGTDGDPRLDPATTGAVVHRVPIAGKTFARSLTRLRAIVKSESIDVIHVNQDGNSTVMGMALRAITGKPLLIHHHGSPPLLTPRQRGVLFAAARVATANVGVSRFIADELTRGGIVARKVTYVLNAVNAEAFSPDNDGSAVRAELGYTSDDIVVLQLARVWQAKRQEDLVRALAFAREKDPRVKALIVGWDDPQYTGTYGSYREELVALAEQLGVTEHVQFHQARPDAAAVMAAADIVCLPSVDEPCALVVFEALATGKAFIGARSGGTPEVVRDGRTGLLHDPRSARDLAGAILDVAADPAKRASFGAAARADMLRNFTERHLAADFAAIYHAVHDRRPLPPANPRTD